MGTLPFYFLVDLVFVLPHFYFFLILSLFVSSQQAVHVA